VNPLRFLHQTARQDEPAADHLQFAKCFIVTSTYYVQFYRIMHSMPRACALSIKTDNRHKIFCIQITDNTCSCRVTVHHVGNRSITQKCPLPIFIVSGQIVKSEQGDDRRFPLPKLP